MKEIKKKLTFPSDELTEFMELNELYLGQSFTLTSNNDPYYWHEKNFPLSIEINGRMLKPSIRTLKIQEQQKPNIVKEKVVQFPELYTTKVVQFPELYFTKISVLNHEVEEVGLYVSTNANGKFYPLYLPNSTNHGMMCLGVLTDYVFIGTQDYELQEGIDAFWFTTFYFSYYSDLTEETCFALKDGVYHSRIAYDFTYENNYNIFMKSIWDGVK
jgi:hypothetical protein